MSLLGILLAGLEVVADSRMVVLLRLLQNISRSLGPIVLSILRKDRCTIVRNRIGRYTPAVSPTSSVSNYGLPHCRSARDDPMGQKELRHKNTPD